LQEFGPFAVEFRLFLHREPAKNKVRQPHPRFLGGSDSDAITHKLGGDLRDDVADSVVPPGSPANRHFRIADGKLILVIHDAHLTGIPAVIAADRPHRASAFVHERLRFREQDRLPGNDDSCGMGTKPGLIFPPRTLAGGQCIDQTESDIVACPVVLGPRITESHHNTHRHLERTGKATCRNRSPENFRSGPRQSPSRPPRPPTLPRFPRRHSCRPRHPRRRRPRDRRRRCRSHLRSPEARPP